jgi:NDP-sugar pyrophosphorylase family protein
VATIATFEAANPSACGLVITDANGRVTRFQEKPPPHEVFTNTANAGVYVLEPAIFDYLPPGDSLPLDWGKDVFPLLLERGIIYSCPLNGYLQDTGTPDTYRQANWDALSGATGEPTAGNANLLTGEKHKDRAVGDAPGAQYRRQRRGGRKRRVSCRYHRVGRLSDRSGRARQRRRARPQRHGRRWGP